MGYYLNTHRNTQGTGGQGLIRYPPTRRAGMASSGLVQTVQSSFLNDDADHHELEPASWKAKLSVGLWNDLSSIATAFIVKAPLGHFVRQALKVVIKRHLGAGAGGNTKFIKCALIA